MSLQWGGCGEEQLRGWAMSPEAKSNACSEARVPWSLERTGAQWWATLHGFSSFCLLIVDL